MGIFADRSVAIAPTPGTRGLPEVTFCKMASMEACKLSAMVLLSLLCSAHRSSRMRIDGPAARSIIGAAVDAPEYGVPRSHDKRTFNRCCQSGAQGAQDRRGESSRERRQQTSREALPMVSLELDPSTDPHSFLPAHSASERHCWIAL